MTSAPHNPSKGAPATPDAPLGLVLTGGAGTRLRPLTLETPKAAVPLLNRPLVAYSLDMLARAGITEIVVVLGGGDEQTGPLALQHAPDGVTVTLAVQPEPLGSGDALTAAGEALDGRRVVAAAVDTVLRGELRPQVEAFMRADVASWLVLHESDRPREMGIAELEGERIVHFEEKPERPRSNLANVGVWMLAPEAVERLRGDPYVNARGEVDLSGTLAAMLREGRPMGGMRFDGDWLDTGDVAGLLDAQRALLRDRDGGSVLIAEGATVEHCELGPDVVIGRGAKLRGVTLSDALVSPGAHLDGAGLDGPLRGVTVAPSGAIGRR